MAIQLHHHSTPTLKYEQKPNPPCLSINQRTKGLKINAVTGRSTRRLIQSGAVRPISPNTAATAKNSEGFLLLDIRPTWERGKARVEGSLHVPLFVKDMDDSPLTFLKKWLNFGYIGLWTGQNFTAITDEFLRQVDELVPDKNTKLLVACGKGLRSMMAASKVNDGGYLNLGWLTGGLNLAGDHDFPTVEGREKLQYASIGGVSYCFLQLLILFRVLNWEERATSSPLRSEKFGPSIKRVDLRAGSKLKKQNFGPSLSLCSSARNRPEARLSTYTGHSFNPCCFKPVKYSKIQLRPSNPSKVMDCVVKLRFSNLANTSANASFLIPLKTAFYPGYPAKSSLSSATLPSRTTSQYSINKPIILKFATKRSYLAQKPPKSNFRELPSDGYPRIIILGTVSIGIMLFLMGMEGQKALAFGPEGPLMEDFWDNMRRYGLYILTVSTGVIYTILQPILELLKNPISAILLLIILGGSIYIVSQVLSAMVGVSNFDYQYGY